VPTADIEHHRRLHGMLPAELKMDVVLAREDGRPCAGAIVATAGDTAVYLFGATNEAGMRSSGAYLVQWEVLKRLKDRGIRLYDLHGINPELNPGTYHFKKGLAPRTAKEVTFSGQVQSFEPSIRNRSLLLLERWYRARRARRTSSVNPPSAVAAVSTT
jgi:lipid II:glycine glycyltransferase (peptidoglycan interpeptide bridge formation enzyme)